MMSGLSRSAKTSAKVARSATATATTADAVSGVCWENVTRQSMPSDHAVLQIDAIATRGSPRSTLETVAAVVRATVAIARCDLPHRWRADLSAPPTPAAMPC